MKLASVILENVKSFRDRTELQLEHDMNILVGPNGGGKSNFLDAVTVAVRRDVLPAFRINTRSRGELQIDRVSHFQRLHEVLPKYSGNENNPQSIALEIVFEESDCRNIRTIHGNHSRFQDISHRFKNPQAIPLSQMEDWDPDSFEPGTHAKVCITEGQAKWQGDDPKLSAWKQYASYFELYSLLLHETGGPRLHPAFLYFSPFRGSASTDHFQANLSSSTFSQILAGYLGSTSTSRTSLIRSASLYFAEKHRILEGEALDQGFLSRWQEDPEVQLVTRHLERLGYEWTLELVDPRKNLYEMQLTKDDMQFDISQASSGEKEIVNYILGIFALNLQDGLLAVDEVELHLHPRWQALLLDILFELSKDTGNQILLSTHSPIFVTPTSVGHVVRVFRDDEQVSRLIKVEDPQDQQTRNTIHIVNAHNNAKMFFADRIILVEGIQDRLVFERLVELFREARESIEVVEVLEVHGKGNFLKYRSFLDRLSVPNTVIADLDYLCQVGKDEADALFITNDDGIDDNVLKNKKSRDRGTLSAVMREALEKNDLESLERLWRYIESRHIRLKDELSVEEMALLKSELKHLEEEGIYLLSRGEIEDYLPEDKSSLEGTVHLIEEPAFEKWLWNNWANGTGELVGKVAEILGAREGEIVRIRALAKKRATGK